MKERTSARRGYLRARTGPVDREKSQSRTGRRAESKKSLGNGKGTIRDLQAEVGAGR